MPIDRALIRDVRALDEYDLRRLQIFINGLLHVDGAASSEFARAKKATVTYRLEQVNCGKKGCTRCPHGPYWYAYWREGGRLRSRYVGRENPDSTGPEGQGKGQGKGQAKGRSGVKGDFV